MKNLENIGLAFCDRYLTAREGTDQPEHPRVLICLSSHKLYMSVAILKIN